jgi:hypothetical protein
MDPDSSTPPDALPVITLRSAREAPPLASSAGQIGIAAAGEVKTLAIADAVTALDVTFPPLGGCPPTGLSFNGGAIGTADAVQLLFWGLIWQTLLDPANSPPNSPSPQLLSTSFIRFVQSILAGPYMSGLLPYGVRRCPYGNAWIVNSNPPFLPNTFTTQSVQNLMQSLINNGSFPEPDENGGRNLYFFIMPPNTQFQPPPGGVAANGAHSSFQSGSVIDPDKVWWAWIGNNPLNVMTSTFTHELAEMCTDPEPFTGFSINGGANPGCNEIGDVCNLQNIPWNVNGVNGAAAQSYWSTLASWVPASQSWTKACLVPTAWSLRRTLAAVGKNLGGQGLLSLQGPIPSMNQFVVNL